jgi:hypothetical protein
MNDQRQYWYNTVYNTRRWKQLRLIHITSHPDNVLCLCCLNGHQYCCSGMTSIESSTIEGYGRKRIEPMYLVDHAYPVTLGGDPWSLDHLRSYCLSCHSRKTRRVDKMIQRNIRIDQCHQELEDFDQ